LRRGKERGACEDDVDDEVYSVSGHERASRLLALIVGVLILSRGAARARTVCLLPPTTAFAARAYRCRRRRNGRPSRSSHAVRPIGGSPRRHRLDQRSARHDLYANAEYATAFPNCGGPNNLSQAFPLDYWQPKIGIGVAWPNPKDYRYEMQSVPLIDGTDGTCAQYSNQPGKVTNWWVYELKGAKAWLLRVHREREFPEGREGILCRAQWLQARVPPAATGAQ
jgi:hypothetical protein